MRLGLFHFPRQGSQYLAYTFFVSGKIKPTTHQYLTIMSHQNDAVKAGISFGSALAMVISWSQNGSVLWAILHGLFSWFYVIYYVVSR